MRTKRSTRRYKADLALRCAKVLQEMIHFSQLFPLLYVVGDAFSIRFACHEQSHQRNQGDSTMAIAGA